MKLDERSTAAVTKGVGITGPSFLFIGPSKAGSSWFFEILREHPHVFVPNNKATFFFSAYYEQGIGWYESFFAKAKGREVCGEVCHDYLASRESLYRIRDYRSDMRVICCLRNPYERALSSWRFFRRNGMDEPTLAAQAIRYPTVFEEGYYATHLSELRKIFPDEQILLFFFEELAGDPEGVVRRLYDFVGVASDFRPPSIHARINVNATPRCRLLARVAQNVHQQSWKKSRMFSNFIGAVKRIKPFRRLVRSALYSESLPAPDWRKHLNEFPPRVVRRYECEIALLEAMLKRDLTHWHASAEFPARIPPSMEPTSQVSVAPARASHGQSPHRKTML